MKGRVLIIAGSDSGGGAGIQADIKSVTALGGYAMTAITALTAQNTQGVFGIHAVPEAFIRQQIELCLTDIGADCIKTGMLATAATIETVVTALGEFAPTVPLVADPVMVAKGGAALLEESAVGAVRRLLLPRATVVTPNLPEAEGLLGRRIASAAEMRDAGKALLQLGPKAVLMKGGHLAGATVIDVLVTADEVQAFESPRIDSRHTHGTGCTLASAIATGLAQGMKLAEAVARARAYVQAAIRSAPGYGKGHGPLDHAVTIDPRRIEADRLKGA
ncbi:MAG: bifunctional hydroxymethylpyrimidine kinase/phosphomethylpyrimidine kinase [Rhodospirillaceae bacterium]|nr:bifunctional hydroxymethylpyrimidine kinase/phosphomethylpyrimidine kinase [Rhodospirillaceae bacterium]